MKYKDWSEFKIWVSTIHDIVKPPKGVTPLTQKQLTTRERILNKVDLNDKDRGTLLFYEEKEKRFLNPELSQAAKKFLISRYGWHKYNKRVVPHGKSASPQAKGNELESDAIKILSQLDKTEYIKPDCLISNDYMYGRCDIYSDKKIIDIKTSWNINTFLETTEVKLPSKYFYQMQGYMELYNIDVSEVCFVLLNTPIHLIDREIAKQTEKYVFGEITREKYEEEMQKCDMLFNYEKIPLKRRVIRFEVQRDKQVVEKVFQRVERCRVWLGEYERKHLSNKKIITSYKDYFNVKEDNTESDTTEPLSSDEG